MEQVTESGTCRVPHALTHKTVQNDVSERRPITHKAAQDQYLLLICHTENDKLAFEHPQTV